MTRLDEGFEAVEDYYETLGVPSNSTLDEITAAFHKKALETHPDRNKSPIAAEQFKRLQMAYETLSNPDERRFYDTNRLFAISANPTSWGSRRLEAAVDMWVRETLPEGLLKAIADQVLVNRIRIAMGDYAAATGMQPSQEFADPAHRTEAAALVLSLVEAHKNTLIGMVNSYPTAKEPPALGGNGYQLHG